MTDPRTDPGTDPHTNPGGDRAPGTAIVAGVGPNLGAGLVRGFRARGATVGAVARTESRLESLAAETTATDTGGRVVPLSADLTDPDAVAAAVDRFHDRAGPVDLLAYTAYYTDTNPRGIDDIDPATMLRDYEVNVYGAAAVVRALLDDLRDPASPGTVILTGAPSGVRAGGDAIVFDTTESAVRGLARSLARDLAPAVHVAYAVVDASVGSATGATSAASVADAYWQLATQPRDAWTTELDLRPAGGSFRT